MDLIFYRSLLDLLLLQLWSDWLNQIKFFTLVTQCSNFTFYRVDLFKYLSFNNIKNADYPEHWSSHLQESFSHCAKIKRTEGRIAPFFYSSHTMCLLNQKKTNLCKLTKGLTVLLSLKQRELINLWTSQMNWTSKFLLENWTFHLPTFFSYCECLATVSLYLVLCPITEFICPLILRSQTVLKSLISVFVPNLKRMSQNFKKLASDIDRRPNFFRSWCNNLINSLSWLYLNGSW